MATPGKTLIAIAAISMAAFVYGDARSEAVRSLLTLERRQLAIENRRFGEATHRLEGAMTELSSASRAASESASRADGNWNESADALARAASAVEALVLEQRLHLERISDVRERIADLEKDSGGRGRREDLLSGDWKFRVDPGEQEGDLHLSLDGTLVSGDYTLEGGFLGSVRGTLVSDRLKFDRIDSRLGLSAVYYGRLSRDGLSLSGTWESTDVSGGSPSSGTWSARKQGSDLEGR
ncbi:MAG: hypothetical protein ACRD16_11890 [Thermoanaerobaculia bacterium]